MRPDVKRVPLVGLGLRRRRGGHRPAARLPVRPPRRGGRAAVGRALLAHRPARRRLDPQPGGQRALRRRRGGRGRGRRATAPRSHDEARPKGTASQPRCSPAAAGSTPTPSAPWAGTSAPTGFRIVLSADVPDLVATYLRGDVDDFLADQGLQRRDIEWWVCHPGGPKVLEAMQSALEVERDALAAHLGLAGPDRQPVVGLGAARPRGHPPRAAAAARVATASRWRWARASASSSCCCRADRMDSTAGLCVHRAGRPGRSRAAGRARRLDAQRRLEHEPRWRRDRTAPLPR